jgi:hypothetical protein
VDEENQKRVLASGGGHGKSGSGSWKTEGFSDTKIFAWKKRRLTEVARQRNKVFAPRTSAVPRTAKALEFEVSAKWPPKADFEIESASC